MRRVTTRSAFSTKRLFFSYLLLWTPIFSSYFYLEIELKYTLKCTKLHHLKKIRGKGAPLYISYMTGFFSPIFSSYFNLEIWLKHTLKCTKLHCSSMQKIIKKIFWNSPPGNKTFLRPCLDPKIVLLHRCQILRLINKTPPQSIMLTGLEHVVGLRSAPF